MLRCKTLDCSRSMASIEGEIVLSADNVYVYEYRIDGQQLVPKVIGGIASVVKRNTEPFYQLIVLNPTDRENLVENLSRDFWYEVEAPHIFYENSAQEFYGILFDNMHQPQEFGNLFKRIIDWYQQIPPEPRNLDNTCIVHLLDNLTLGFQVSDEVTSSLSSPLFFSLHITGNRLIDMICRFLLQNRCALLGDFEEPEFAALFSMAANLGIMHLSSNLAPGSSTESHVSDVVTSSLSTPRVLAAHYVGSKFASLGYIGLHLLSNLTPSGSPFQASDAVISSPSRPHIISVHISDNRLTGMICGFLLREQRTQLGYFEEPKPADLLNDMICNAQRPLSWVDIPIDLWIEFAKRAGGLSVPRLSGTCRLFRNFAINDDIWKSVFLVETGLLGRLIDEIQVNISWRDIYYRSFLEEHANEEHVNFSYLTAINFTQLGAIVIDSGTALLASKVASPEEAKSGHLGRRRSSDEWTVRPPFVVEDVKKGIWLVDFMEAQSINGTGKHIMLEARHFEEHRQSKGTWHCLGIYSGSKKTQTSLSIFDFAHVDDNENRAIFQGDWTEGVGLCSCVSLHALATSCPLERLNREYANSVSGWCQSSSVDGKHIRLKIQQWWKMRN